jgi:hypothetical protein
MTLGSLPPSPQVGYVLDVLLGEVLEDPKRNTKKYLQTKTKELLSLSKAELLSLSKKAKKARDQVVMKQDSMTKQKYWVS